MFAPSRWMTLKNGHIIIVYFCFYAPLFICWWLIFLIGVTNMYYFRWQSVNILRALDTHISPFPLQGQSTSIVFSLLHVFDISMNSDHKWNLRVTKIIAFWYIDTQKLYIYYYQGIFRSNAMTRANNIKSKYSVTCILPIQFGQLHSGTTWLRLQCISPIL